MIPTLWLQMLKAVRRNLKRVHDLTVYEFYREVAKLGGFLVVRQHGKLELMNVLLATTERYSQVATLSLKPDKALGRKPDGEPGWITIWRGREKLNNLVRGAQLALN